MTWNVVAPREEVATEPVRRERGDRGDRGDKGTRDRGERRDRGDGRDRSTGNDYSGRERDRATAAPLQPGQMKLNPNRVRFSLEVTGYR